ncbi:ROK family protein [Micromonospora sp. NBC_01813]|uniref:ROK family protein n=1 Tax=Micromonospora sp. NBC_01813 TaxID=2975988 RepID=UPI002DD84A4A|nr:ROK family protein [Micromonospora sp. NBC_01813]WSA06586.1 ROK family protein [Micromonospora sp. NBC_01813]
MTPAGPASAAPPDEVVVALDVGGTSIKAALVGRGDRTVRHTERQVTGAARGPAAVIDTICDLAGRLADTARADGLTPIAVGIAVPGVVDETAGVAVWSANLGLRDVPLRDLVAARTGLPTALGHDVRAGGVAEARVGAGRGSRHVLFVAIGTGIAAAAVVDGASFAGAHGAAGELGHVVVRPGGPRCGCRQSGCLEAIASAAAVARRYAEQAGRTPDGAAEVARLAAAGDPVAAQVWRETVDVLADGLLIGQAMFDPAVVVLGGGLAEAGDQLIGPLAETLRQRVTFHRLPRLMPAALGDEAGCIGAALLASDLVEVGAQC